MKQALLRIVRHFGYDAHALPWRSLSLRDLSYDLPQLVRSNSPTIFDIGANKGQTIEKMLRVFPDASITAFEPNAELAGQLRNTYALRTNIRIEAIALGPASGNREFIQCENNELSSFLELSRARTNPFSTVQSKAKGLVSVQTVDDYCRIKNLAKVDILKIDTQGFDLEVLKGASRMLTSGGVTLVLVEVNFMPLYEGQCSAGQLVDWLGAQDLSPLCFYEPVRQNLALSWATACFVRR